MVITHAELSGELNNTTGPSVAHGSIGSAAELRPAPWARGLESVKSLQHFETTEGIHCWAI